MLGELTEQARIAPIAWLRERPRICAFAWAFRRSQLQILSAAYIFGVS